MTIILKVFAGEIACQPGRLPLIALPRYPRWAGLAERNGYPHIRLESEAPWELNKYDFDLKLAKNRKGQQSSNPLKWEPTAPVIPKCFELTNPT
jgi:hypothetical protein